MKRLFIIRHAKSSWDHPGLADFDRPLNARGEKGAYLVGNYLNLLEYTPEKILCSAAHRTRQTLDLILREWQASPEIIYKKELYHTSALQIGQLIQREENKYDCLGIIGHNPVMHELSGNLIHSESMESAYQLFGKFPTASVVSLELPIDNWAELSWGQATLADFVTPKILMSRAGQHKD